MIMATMSARSRSLTKSTTATSMRPRTMAVDVSMTRIIPRPKRGQVDQSLPNLLGTEYHLQSMSCRKDKPKVKPKPGRYRCEDCGAVGKKKKDVCDPKKVKKGAVKSSPTEKNTRPR